MKKRNLRGLEAELRRMYEASPRKENYKNFLKGDRVKKLIEANRLFGKLMTRNDADANMFGEYMREHFNADEFQIKVTKDKGAYLTYKPHDPQRMFQVDSTGICVELDTRQKGVVIGNIIQENNREG